MIVHLVLIPPPLLSLVSQSSHIACCAVVNMAARSIGHMDPCDENKEYWCTYCERLEQFFDANDDDIKDPKKVSSLITFLGSKMYKLLKSLTTLAKPAEKSCDDLVKILSGHLAPKQILIAESFKFHQEIFQWSCIVDFL